MKTTYHLITAILLLCATNIFAQQIRWKELSKKEINNISVSKQSVQPKKFKIFKLNSEELISKTKQNKTISLPNNEGSSTQYTYQENSVLSSELQKKFPEIKSFKGKSLDGKQTIHFNYSPYQGFNAIIFNQNKTSYIDSYSTDLKTYITYEKSDTEKSESFSCKTLNNSNEISFLNKVPQTLSTKNKSNSALRKYRLAVATTVEYSQFHLNNYSINNTLSERDKKAIVMSAITTAINRVNSIYEKELSITFELVADNENIIFIDNDEYSNDEGGLMIKENQEIIDKTIGNSNYDIGHVFSTGGGGIAYLAKACQNKFKAGGVTGLPAPINDPYYVDYVSHEIGHQLGANHIFTSTKGYCGDNKAFLTSIEPGSGSSIMGYAGICGTENIQENSDPYFSAINIEEINNFINKLGSCSKNLFTGNSKPEIKINKTNFTIPHSTPFKLSAEATDDNQDDLTYHWEQIDPSTNSDLPTSTNQKGALFRSLKPSKNNFRYFPSYDKILVNKLTIQKNTVPIEWETLPSVERILNFALTVRDNNPNGGLTDRKDIKIQVTNSGPFKVTSQNTTENWKAGEEKTITWDTANTNNNDVNTTHVKILLSLDGGLTWNYTLKESTPNNGSYNFIVPYSIGNTSDARLMIQPTNNIYFAINTNNFIINSPDPIIKKEELSSPQLFPNPVKNEVRLMLHKEFSDIDVYVYDMSGKLVFNETSYQSTKKLFQLNLSHLINGIYIVKIFADTEEFTKKIIVQK